MWILQCTTPTPRRNPIKRAKSLRRHVSLIRIHPKCILRSATWRHETFRTSTKPTTPQRSPIIPQRRSITKRPLIRIRNGREGISVSATFIFTKGTSRKLSRAFGVRPKKQVRDYPAPTTVSAKHCFGKATTIRRSLSYVERLTLHLRNPQLGAGSKRGLASASPASIPSKAAMIWRRGRGCGCTISKET